MADVNEGDCIRLGVQYSGKGSKGAALVFHVYCGSLPYGGITAAAFMTPAVTWMTDLLHKMDDTMSNDWTAYLLTGFNETTGKDLGSQALSVSGVQPADAEASPVAALWSLRTSTKKVTGKKFLPGFVEAALDEGFWTGGVQQMLAEALLSYIAGFKITGAPASWVIPVVYTVGTQAVRWITRAAVRGFPGIQRRRRLMVY